MIASWKIPPMAKGMLSWVPLLNAIRKKRAATGGSESARYCYSVWLRHLTLVEPYGFDVQNACIGELGPGDSVGIGWAALLSGAQSYVGLDIVPFSAKADLKKIRDELKELYQANAQIPDDTEFPGVRPKLSSYAFPSRLVHYSGNVDPAKLRYCAPWTSIAEVDIRSLDLILSQAVLEHVDSLAETYQAMYQWLKPGGLGSHVIDFSAHHLSPYWNGHWAYSDWEWKLVRGRREFLLNREPLSTHLNLAKSVGFEIVHLHCDYDNGGCLQTHITGEDAKTRGAILIVRKPH